MTHIGKPFPRTTTAFALASYDVERFNRPLAHALLNGVHISPASDIPVLWQLRRGHQQGHAASV